MLRVTGHLFKARFGSVTVDEGARDDGGAANLAMSPVRARLVERAEGSRWSSVAPHLAGPGDDDLVSVAPLLDRCAGRFADPDLNRDGAVG